ncbi:hypothetical protein [Hymenobacter siberiensis]|uniref:hypothetical protein n=1 Tax=Hymenobacter siberiensis TaxID=2848396 RepID=UPI001F1B24E2|nr:hypothetical protein [Hymenobacter siberiensis]
MALLHVHLLVQQELLALSRAQRLVQRRQKYVAPEGKRRQARRGQVHNGEGARIGLRVLPGQLAQRPHVAHRHCQLIKRPQRINTHGSDE